MIAPYSPGAADVFDYYVRKGWYFIHDSGCSFSRSRGIPHGAYLLLLGLALVGLFCWRGWR